MRSPADPVAETTSRTLFRRTYPGHPSQVGLVRHDLAEITTGFPLADELALLASELCANAVVHSRSGKPGGRFTVLANVHPGKFVWIEVMDQGGIWESRPHGDDRPHGLDIVRAVAGDGNWGVDGDGSFARVVWARLCWPGD
jgi:serine/threonine-protein kinase RsbW